MMRSAWQPSSQHKNLLIIDDSLTTYYEIIESLQSEPYAISRLEMFIQLPTILRTNPPNLIILDINTSSLSGIKMGQMIRRYQKQHIPIIVYSSSEPNQRLHVANEINAVTHLQKGCSKKELCATIRMALLCQDLGDSNPSHTTF